MADKARHDKTTPSRQARSHDREARESHGHGLAPPAYGVAVVDRSRAAGGYRGAAAPAPVTRQSGVAGLPAPVLGKMERYFGADFSGLKIQPSSSRAPALGALAYTQGDTIHFAPGQFQPHTRSGQELLGHELAHVVQQRQGRVRATARLASGVALNDSPLLEAEADRAGRLAAASPDVPVQARCSACSQRRAEEARLARAAATSRAVDRLFAAVTRRGPESGPIQLARAELKAGPKYNRHGVLSVPDQGAGQSTTFRFTAEFKNDASRNVSPACGEIRQEILWTNRTDIDGHGALDDHTAFRHNTWYEDRDRNDYRYGHRNDAHTDAGPGDGYFDADGTTMNQAAGVKYKGQDSPGSPGGGLKGKWKFRLKAIDTCSHDAQVGEYDYVTVDWS